jgi:adenylate cyclase
MFRFEGFTLDVRRSSLRAADREIELRHKTFEVLRYLLENADRVVSKEEMIKAIWPNVVVTDESLTHCVSEARHAIGDAEQTIIKTVPRRGYRFAVPVSRMASDGPTGSPLTPAGTSGSEANSGIELQRGTSFADRPSIAVLAFLNLSGDLQQDYFSDGITEDIITELSRFSELMVIARNSTFQYKGKPVDIRQIGRELGVRHVLEGSVRRDGDRIRVTAQLIDAMTGAHRWAERYDRHLSNVFAVQDEVARSIVTVLASYLNKAETERTLLKPPATWEAYDYYLCGAAAYFASIRDHAPNSEARRLFEKSLEIDPNYARAYAMLARTWMRTFWDPIDGDYLDPACIDRAFELARKAVQLDENLPQAHFHLGMALLLKRQHDEAVAEFDRTFALNPNYTDHQFGNGLSLAGQSARAIEVLQENVRLDPFGFPSRLCYLGQAFYMLGRYTQAVPPLRECASRLPFQWNCFVFLAAAHAQLGQFDDAKAAVAQALRLHSAFTIEKINRALPYSNVSDAEHLADGLRKAGLPEG